MRASLTSLDIHSTHAGTHPQPGEQPGARARRRRHGAPRPRIPANEPDRRGCPTGDGVGDQDGRSRRRFQRRVRLGPRQRREGAAVPEPAQLGADEPVEVLGPRVRRREAGFGATRDDDGRDAPPTIQLVHVNPRARARRSVVERRRRRRDAAARGGERTAPRAPRH